MTSNAPVKVWILIVNYNSGEDCILCLQSLLKSDFQDFGIVIVDNHSTDSSLAELEQFFRLHLPESMILDSRALDENTFRQTRLVLVRHHLNPGFASGNNVALKWLQEQNAWIWLLNPDIQVDPSTISFLLQDAGEDKNQIIGTRVFSSQNPEKLLHTGAWKINWFAGNVSPVKAPDQPFDYIYGGSLFTHAENFKKYGLLPEEYFLYWEETDWCFRLSGAGVKLKISSLARVFDRVGGSIGRGYLAFFYYTLNSLRFVKKQKPEMVKWVIISNVFRVLKKLFFLRFKQARGIWSGTVAFLKL